MQNIKTIQQSVQKFTVTEDHDKQRVDNFLYQWFYKLVPRSYIYSLIRSGQVRVNGGRVKISYQLNIKDQLRIPPIKPELYQLVCDYQHNYYQNNNKLITKLSLNKNSDYYRNLQDQIKQAIIFENDSLLIINKPAKLAVHGGSKVKIGLIEILRDLRSTDPFLELVHRLDRDTSGCILVAKKRAYLKQLHGLLKNQKITKIYSALVKGKLSKKQVIEKPLKKIIRNSKEHFVMVARDGNYAKTICLPEKYFNYVSNLKIGSSLIKVKLLTGKTHQIRVHLADLGLPIANDDKYGDKDYNLKMRKLGLNRMFLHAQKIEFVCPKTKEIISAEAKYDSQLNNILLKLEQISG